VDIKRNSYHHYQAEQDEEEEEEEVGMEEGRTPTAKGGRTFGSKREGGTPTNRRSVSFFSIGRGQQQQRQQEAAAAAAEEGGEGIGAPSPRSLLPRLSRSGSEGGMGAPSPRSFLPRLSPRGISMMSPRNLLRKKNKQRPNALKTEGELVGGEGGRAGGVGG